MPYAGICVFSRGAFNKANIFHYIHMFCDSENLPLPDDIPQSQMKSSFIRWKFGSLCESFWSHMQSRGGSRSEMSCLRNKDIPSFASFITSELMNPGVCCTHLFSPS
jgi:hypothetical protein